MGKLFRRLMGLGRNGSTPSERRESGGKDYRAVSIVPNASACADAKRLRRFRYLSNEAPRLPLPQCPQPLTCSCSYSKFPDRRVTERRDIASSGRWYMGLDRRKSSGRRATDHHLARIEITWPQRE